MADKRIYELTTTATEADLVAGKFFVMDGQSGPTPKLPANLVAPRSIQDNVVKSLAPEFDPEKPNDSDGYAYHVNDLVVHLGRLYHFIANTTTGAWDATKVEAMDVGTLADEIDYRTSTLKITDFTRGYIATSSSTVDPTTIVDNAQFVYAVVNCSAGDRFTISGQAGSTPRVWCFISSDASNNNLAVAANGITASSDMIVAPEGAVKLVVNFLKAQDYSLYKGCVVGQVAEDLYKIPASKYTIYPTGDTTSRVSDILAILNKGKVCYFAPGDYYISTTLTLPDSSKLVGTGKGTHLIYSSGTTGQMIDCGKDCQLSGMWLDGGHTANPGSSGTNRHGIRLKTNKQTLMMHDCVVGGFGGTGIRVDNTGYADLRSVEIVNCAFECNGMGIYFMEHGEYGLVANSQFIDNHIGLYVQGGNNIVNGCAIERNTYGATINGNGIDNSGHGAFIGCSFNHNTSNGLEVTSTTNGYVISGCQFFRNDGKEITTNSTGVNVCGCNFGVSSKLQFTGTAFATLSNCCFGSSPTLTYTGTARTASHHNYKFDGTPVNVLHPSTLVDDTDEMLKRFNADNIFGFLNKESTEINDITYKVENGKFEFTAGTTSAFTAVNIGEPIVTPLDGIKAGEEVYVYFSDVPPEKFTLQVLIYGTSTVVFETKTMGHFKAPADSTSLRFRIAVGNGTAVAGFSFTPYVGKNLAGQHIANLLVPSDFKPMLTIIDDDAHEGFYNDLLPIIQAEKVPLSCAAPISDLGTVSHMTWAQVEECYENGAEILSHTYNHQTSYSESVTEHDVEMDYGKAKNYLFRHGISGGQFLVFSGSTGEDARAKEAAPYVYNIAINSAGNAINHLQGINRFRIQRYRIQTDGYDYDLDKLKELIDDCLADGKGWMVWMMHTSDESWDATAKANLIAAIQYAKANDLPIVTVDYVWRTFLRHIK